MTLPTLPSSINSREYLRIGGGYGSPATGSSPAGGLDVDHAGNLAADGDATIGGDLSLGGVVGSDLHFAGDLRQGSGGCDKTWFTVLHPGAGIEPGTSGPTTVYNLNAHQKLIAIPFDGTTQENAALTFALPPDYDGSTLAITFFWTCAQSGLSGDGFWKIYGAVDAAGDGDNLNQTVGVGTGLRCQSLDTYQGQWLLHVAETSCAFGGVQGGIVGGTLARSVEVDPISADALLIAIRIAYQ